MSAHDAVSLYTVRRMQLAPYVFADFMFCERADTLAAAHGAAAEWRAITNEQGLAFYCRVEIVIPATRKGRGFYRIWVGPQERKAALKHLPEENVERRNDVLRAKLKAVPRTKHRKRPKRAAS